MNDSITIGWLYPSWWFGEDEAVAAEVDRIRAIDPRLEVIIEPYEESGESRTIRGGDDPDRGRSLAPELTDEQRACFGEIEIALTLDLPFDVAEVAPDLRWVQAVGAGTTQLWSAGLENAGIRLTSSAGSNAVAIAEFVVGRLLEAWKRFPEIAEHQAERDWHATFGRELSGSTVGLIGLGEINQRVAARLNAFEVTVLATRRRWEEPIDGIAEQFPPDRLHEMLARCDAVIAAVPQVPSTDDLMDADAFAAMPEGSWFCNVGRGNVVDERALFDALDSGHLAGAAIDVARNEPLPQDDPLWTARNLRISFHNAAAPDRLFVNLHELFHLNLRAYLAGKPLRNEVGFSA